MNIAHFSQNKFLRNYVSNTKFILEDLKEYVGDLKPIYFSVKGKIYDVSDSAHFYGKGNAYHVFAGNDCTRCLALMSTETSELNKGIEDLGADDLKVLDDWIKKLESKYPVVGYLQDAPSRE